MTTKKKKVVKKKAVKKTAKKKVTKKKTTKKKVVRKAKAVQPALDPILCDKCGDPTGFNTAVEGLDKHNVATCSDCLIAFDKKKKEEENYLLNRSRIRRNRLFSRCFNRMGGY